jgi:hypothetical protein
VRAGAAGELLFPQPDLHANVLLSRADRSWRRGEIFPARTHANTIILEYILHTQTADVTVWAIGVMPYRRV